MRLVDTDNIQRWDNRGHFFAAAAEAMRRILVERARRKASARQGGKLTRRALDPDQIGDPGRADELLALDETLERLNGVDQAVAQLVRLRYFAGLTIPQAAAVMAVSPRTADNYWAMPRPG